MSKCLLCGKESLMKFIDKNYLVQYCETCKLSITNSKTFKKLCLNKLNTLDYSNLSKQCINDYLEHTFLNKEFGIIKKLEQCQDNCGYLKDKYCFVYKYNFDKFEYYYCFHKDLIFFKEEDIEVLLKCINKFTLKFRIKTIINNILIKIKNLFVKQIDN